MSTSEIVHFRRDFLPDVEWTDEPIRVLAPDDEEAIANWDAELYRKALARRPA